MGQWSNQGEISSIDSYGPGAVIGAMLAEWLATGQGMGYGMQYNSIAILESAVPARFSLRGANA